MKRKKLKYGGLALATLLMVTTLAGCKEDETKEKENNEVAVVSVNEDGKKVYKGYKAYKDVPEKEKIQEVWVVYNGNTDYYHLSYKDKADPNFQSSVYAKDTLQKVAPFGIVDLLYGQTRLELDPVVFTTAFEEVGNTFFNGINIIEGVIKYGEGMGGQNTTDWKTFKKAYDNTIVELGVTIKVLEDIKVKGDLGEAVKNATVLALKDGLEGLKGLEKHLDKDKKLFGIEEEETQAYINAEIKPALYASDYMYDLYYALVESTLEVAYDIKDTVNDKLVNAYTTLQEDSNSRKELLALLKETYRDVQNVLYLTMSNTDLQFALTNGAYKSVTEYKAIYTEQLSDVKKSYTKVKDIVDKGQYSEETQQVAKVMLDSMLEAINSREKYIQSLKEEDKFVVFDEKKLLEAEKSKAEATTLNISLYKVFDVLAKEPEYNEVFYTTSNVNPEDIQLTEEELESLNIDIHPDDWQDVGGSEE